MLIPQSVAANTLNKCTLDWTKKAPGLLVLYKNLVRYKCATVVLEEGCIESVKLDFHMVHFLYLSVDELYKQN